MNVINQQITFSSLTMSDHHQTLRISPISSNNIVYFVKDDPILHVSSQEPSKSSKSPTYPFSAKSCLIWIKLFGHIPYHLTPWSMMAQMTHSSLQSGTINVLQVPTFSILSQIMSNLDQTLKIFLISSNNSQD